jgi:hypothetical protein
VASVITISRSDVVALIEEAANRMTGGNTTEALALAMRCWLERGGRAGSLFGSHKGSVRIAADVDLTAPVLDVVPDAETGRDVER